MAVLDMSTAADGSIHTIDLKSTCRYKRTCKIDTLVRMRCSRTLQQRVPVDHTVTLTKVDCGAMSVATQGTLARTCILGRGDALSDASVSRLTGCVSEGFMLLV
jgi:hypothetical protein